MAPLRWNMFIVTVLTAGLISPDAWAASGEVKVFFRPKTVRVTTGFSGADVLVVGRVPVDVDGVIAVCESSHRPPITLARKERVLGLWMATKRFHIENVPGLFMLTSNVPLEELLGDQLESAILEHEFAYEALRHEWQVERLAGQEADDDMQVLFDGLIHVKQKQGLYEIAEEPIWHEEGGVYFHTFHLPDCVPFGKLTIRVFAVKDHEIIASGTEEFDVVRAGMVSWLETMAADHAVLYGVFAVIVAAAAGLGVSAVFGGRGGH